MADHIKDAVEKQWQLERRMKQFHINQGSKYPPFSIEHMWQERDRLSGSGMTAEDRLLRKQWLTDQVLSHDEPKDIPELYPKNFFRRVYGMPWNIFYRAVTPLFGRERAFLLRWSIPKLCLAYLSVNIAIYHLMYNGKTWESISGWEVLQAKPKNLHGVMAPSKSGQDHCDLGFQTRKVFTDDIKTSFNSEFSS